MIKFLFIDILISLIHLKRILLKFIWTKINADRNTFETQNLVSSKICKNYCYCINYCSQLFNKHISEIKCSQALGLHITLCSLVSQCSLLPRWLCATRTEMTRPSCLPAHARTADGPALAPRTRGVAWREDAAGDTLCRTAEATPPLQHHRAARTLMPAASCPLAASASRTSVKGEGVWDWSPLSGSQTGPGIYRAVMALQGTAWLTLGFGFQLWKGLKKKKS